MRRLGGIAYEKIGPEITLFDIIDMCDCQVLKESFKIYCAINDGIINLIDKVN